MNTDNDWTTSLWWGKELVGKVQTNLKFPPSVVYSQDSNPPSQSLITSMDILHYGLRKLQHIMPFTTV